MAALTHTSKKLSALGIGAIALSGAFLAFGAGTASADENSPGPAMAEIGETGQVSSRQASSIAGSDFCAVNPGTLSTASAYTPDINVPKQLAQEAGPEWVGSRGWQAVGINPADPWGGNFDPQNTSTGPVCSSVSAGGF
jgi:hypothetical protein